MARNEESAEGSLVGWGRVGRMGGKFWGRRTERLGSWKFRIQCSIQIFGSKYNYSQYDTYLDSFDVTRSACAKTVKN